jgi:hypothetical protein
MMNLRINTDVENRIPSRVQRKDEEKFGLLINKKEQKKMKKEIYINLFRAIRVAFFLFIVIGLSFFPVASYAQSPQIDSGVAWLLANQNPSGSWGDPELTEFRDTTVVVDVLKKLRKTGTGYTNAINFINSTSPPNNDYMARKSSVLAQEGRDVSSMINALLSVRNPAEFDNTLPNYPEGGWGAVQYHATNNLDTTLVLNALNAAGLAGGLSISDEALGPGETDEFQFNLPVGATSLAIVITKLTGAIDFRIKQGSPPTLADPYYHLTFAPVNLSGLPLQPGTNYIRIDSSVSSTYSLEVSYVANGFDTKSLLTPINYLKASQNPDGGWGISKGADSYIYITSKVLITLEQYSIYFDLDTNISNGIAWLKAKKNADGGFGTGGSSIYETALAYIAMANVDLSSPQAQNALNYILTNQQGNGSWNGKAYDTAVSLRAIWTSMRTVDSDGDGVPDIMDNCPGVSNPAQTNTDGDMWGDACDDDDDNDGLPDAYEESLTKTNPLLVDTDGDGISDGLEDMDFDGITNADEYAHGTDPRKPDVSLSAGLNIFGYPVDIPNGYTSYNLLADLGAQDEISKIERYNPATGTFETTTYTGGVASGDQFNIVEGEGYYVYMKEAKSVSFAGQIISPAIELSPGLNIVAIPCMPSNYTSYDLLYYLGSPDEVASIQRFNKEIGAFETTAYYNGLALGIEFRIVNGEAYLIHMKVAKVITAPISAPVVVITSPGNGETVSGSPINVSGTISASSSTVTVNGIVATVSAGTFTATGVPLSEGPNTITATAISTNNLTSSHSITVILEGVDYVINKGGSVNDSRNFQGDPALLNQAAYFTENQIDVPGFVTYTTTGVSRVSATDIHISFSIHVSGTAPEGIYEFQVEYGLLDSGGNPLGPLTNNIFSFRIKVVP